MAHMSPDNSNRGSDLVGEEPARGIRILRYLVRVVFWRPSLLTVAAVTLVAAASLLRVNLASPSLTDFFNLKVYFGVAEPAAPNVGPPSAEIAASDRSLAPPLVPLSTQGAGAPRVEFKEIPGGGLRAVPVADPGVYDIDVIPAVLSGDVEELISTEPPPAFAATPSEVAAEFTLTPRHPKAGVTGSVEYVDRQGLCRFLFPVASALQTGGRRRAAWRLVADGTPEGEDAKPALNVLVTIVVRDGRHVAEIVQGFRFRRRGPLRLPQ